MRPDSARGQVRLQNTGSQCGCGPRILRVIHGWVEHPSGAAPAVDPHARATFQSPGLATGHAPARRIIRGEGQGMISQAELMALQAPAKDEGYYLVPARSPIGDLAEASLAETAALLRLKVPDLNRILGAGQPVPLSRF